MAIETERLPPINSSKKLSSQNPDETTGGIYAGKFFDRSPFLQSVSSNLQLFLYIG